MLIEGIIYDWWDEHINTKHNHMWNVSREYLFYMQNGEWIGECRCRQCGENKIVKITCQ